jgi:nucleotide-binding universal stress UspA family protein
MNRVVLVLDARTPSSQLIDFGCQTAVGADALLVGMFVENIYSESLVAQSSREDYLLSDKVKRRFLVSDTDHSVRLFRHQCNKNNVWSEIIVTQGEPIQEILFNSNFSDLLVIDPSIDFYNDDEEFPSHLARRVLSASPSPVILAPQVNEEIREIVFCYDGSASSIFAIKQFTSLFRSYSGKKATLLQIKKQKDKKGDDSHSQMLEWLHLHYETVSHEVHVEDSTGLYDYFFRKRNCMAVMGAYGRNSLSKFFRKSTADPLIRDIDIPIFIAHY